MFHKTRVRGQDVAYIGRLFLGFSLAALSSAKALLNATLGAGGVRGESLVGLCARRARVCRYIVACILAEGALVLVRAVQVVEKGMLAGKHLYMSMLTLVPHGHLTFAPAKMFASWVE